MVRNYAKHFSRLVAVLIGFGLMIGCSSNKEHSATIKEALDVMETRAAELGEPKVSEGMLSFGSTVMNNNFDLVDALQAKYGCTATFFVKKGDEFVRISTDVMTEGHRAIGTILDPDGPVIVKILKDKPFYGVVDILGYQYETGYEPITNAEGEVIGVYYIGFQLEE